MLRLFWAATVLSLGTVLFLALAVPRLYSGYSEADVRATLLAATPGTTLDDRVAAALADGDIDEATQFVELGVTLNKPVDPELIAELEAQQEPFPSFLRNVAEFTGAYITGDADSAAGMAGAIVSDLTVVGDVRDLVSEGGKAAVGEDYSELLLTLAAIGIAAEGLTIATGGASLPVKASISILKVAKRTGNLTEAFAGRLIDLAAAATRRAPDPAPAARVTQPTTAATRAPPNLSRTAARAELRTAVTSLNAMAVSAGPANAVRLLRHVNTTDDAARLATLTGRFGRTSWAVVELTGKTALRAFRTLLRGARLLLAFLYSLLAWLAGLILLRFARRVISGTVSGIRSAFCMVAMP